MNEQYYDPILYLKPDIEKYFSRNSLPCRNSSRRDSLVGQRTCSNFISWETGLQKDPLKDAHESSVIGIGPISNYLILFVKLENSI